MCRNSAIAPESRLVGQGNELLTSFVPGVGAWKYDHYNIVSGSEVGLGISVYLSTDSFDSVSLDRTAVFPDGTHGKAIPRQPVLQVDQLRTEAALPLSAGKDSIEIRLLLQPLPASKAFFRRRR